MVIPLDEEKANAIFVLRENEIHSLIADPNIEPYKTLISIGMLRISWRIPAPMPSNWVAPLLLRDYGRECKIYHTECGWQLWAPITI